MIDDIVFDGTQYFEIQMDSITIQYPMVIMFGSDDSTNIILTEIVSIL
jgi:hypothetical protein